MGRFSWLTNDTECLLLSCIYSCKQLLLPRHLRNTEPIFRNVHFAQVRVEKSLIRARIKLVLHILALLSSCCISFLFPSFLLLFFKTSKALNAAQAGCKFQKSLGYGIYFGQELHLHRWTDPLCLQFHVSVLTRSVAWKWPFLLDQGNLGPLNF